MEEALFLMKNLMSLVYQSHLVIPQNPSVENTNQSPDRKSVNPTKICKRRPLHNSPVVKSLFGQRIILSPMDLQPWITNAFKFDKWLPKLPGNNVISAKEHIDTFYAFFQNHLLNNDDDDVVMKLFVASLVENEIK
jgi:hypothetical protein